MGISFLLSGLLIGLSLAAPLGPLAILCISRTLAEGPRMGFICGLGAAAADGLYALAGTAALSAIGHWVIDDRIALRVVGGAYLVYLGARTFIRPIIALPASGRIVALPAPGARAAFLSAFRLSLANPVNLLGFAAVFAGLGVVPVDTLAGLDSTAAAPVLGVFLGSALWWLALSGLIGRLRPYLGPHVLSVINRIAGTILTAFGLFAFTALLPLL